MSVKSTLGLVLVASALCGGPALAQKAPGQKFITEAIEGNLAEVKMGQLAQEKGQDAGVKSFGQTLVTDHTAANTRAMAVASQIGVTPPSEPTKKQKADYDKLAKLSGATFDKQFASHMVKDHKKDVSAYRADAKKKDPTAAYASETLPTLEQHLQTAMSLQKSLPAR